MPEHGAGEERLADLLRQWQESATPRVGLQLAEEYRRSGRHADARTVLERSLEAHPGHLSSLVALGKARLDLGESDAAAGHFQAVLERDPTHLVAGKLLIEAHLRRGDAGGARERLDLYRLLNAGDPELEDLEGRTEVLERRDREAAGASGPEPAAADAESPAGDADPAAGEADPSEGATAAEAPAGGTPATEAPASAPPSSDDGGTGRGAGRVRKTVLEPGTGDPFGPLAGAGDERRWLNSLGAPGIFAVELPREPEPPAAELAEPEPTASAAAAEAEPAEQLATAAEEEPQGTAPAPALGREPAAAPAPDAAVEPRAAAYEGAEDLQAVADEPESAAGGERATNVLGELYLAQGHLDEAERVFRAVLARRPGDAQAEAGLAEVARRRSAPVSAAALLRWAAGRGHTAPGVDRGSRSAALLRAYLVRVRRGNRADVP